ncbi:hypothetical protein M3Y94_01124500 [Aphelenchoides besseyi]|nr:hypothetical protein M3Y94_01124500 [Aphelenchoides besseyi]KAI6219287.1 hypothetical protein M3Y95_01123300 [Aphelenchoides besseyi]
MTTNNVVEEEFHCLHQDTSVESFQVFLFPQSVPVIKPQFGFDNSIVGISSKFRGLVGLTVGSHYFWFDLGNHCRISFFVWFDFNTVFAPSYENDQFECTAPFREQDVLRIINSYEDFLCQWTENQNQWKLLTRYISQRLLEIILPAKNSGQLCADIPFFSMYEEFDCAEKCKELGVTAVNLKRWATRNQIFKFEAGSLLCFTEIPFLLPTTNNYIDGFVDLFGTEVEYTFLARLLKHFNFEHNGMGEFEFSFVTFWYGHIAACADQWLRILHFLCLMSVEVLEYQICYHKFLTTFHYQLDVMTPSFFSKHVQTNKWVAGSLPLIKRNIGDNGLVRVELRQKARNLQEFLATKFNFSLFN